MFDKAKRDPLDFEVNGERALAGELVMVDEASQFGTARVSKVAETAAKAWAMRTSQAKHVTSNRYPRPADRTRR